MEFIENIHISVGPPSSDPCCSGSTVPGHKWRDPSFSSLPSHAHAPPLKWQQTHTVMLHITNSLPNEYSTQYQQQSTFNTQNCSSLHNRQRVNKWKNCIAFNISRFCIPSLLKALVSLAGGRAIPGEERGWEQAQRCLTEIMYPRNEMGGGPPLIW